MGILLVGLCLTVPLLSVQATPVVDGETSYVAETSIVYTEDGLEDGLLEEDVFFEEEILEDEEIPGGPVQQGLGILPFIFYGMGAMCVVAGIYSRKKAPHEEA